jgi:hypothetical protein
MRCQIVFRRSLQDCWISGGWAASMGLGAKRCSPEQGGCAGVAAVGELAAFRAVFEESLVQGAGEDDG